VVNPKNICKNDILHSNTLNQMTVDFIQKWITYSITISHTLSSLESQITGNPDKLKLRKDKKKESAVRLKQETDCPLTEVPKTPTG
jgi:hypothetical protein